MLLVLAVFSLSCQNKFSAEDQLWNCMVSEYDTLEIDIEEEIGLYEEFLVEENYLENHSAGSYIKLFEGFIEIGDIVPPLHNERYANALQQYINKGYVADCIDTTLFKQTRIYDMQLRAKEVLETAGDIQPNLLSETIVNIYSEEDMEHPLYRYTIMGYLQAFVDKDIGIARQLPPAEDTPNFPVSDRNRIDIELNDKDELFFEGKPMELKNLRSTVITYLKGSGSNDKYPEVNTYQSSEFGEVSTSEAVISIKNSRQTSYARYIEVQNEIVAAFTFVRNEKAMQYYGTPFDSLSEAQQNSIKEIVPMKLLEGTSE